MKDRHALRIKVVNNYDEGIMLINGDKTDVIIYHFPESPGNGPLTQLIFGNKDAVISILLLFPEITISLIDMEKPEQYVVNIYREMSQVLSFIERGVNVYGWSYDDFRFDVNL